MCNSRCRLDVFRDLFYRILDGHLVKTELHVTSSSSLLPYYEFKGCYLTERLFELPQAGPLSKGTTLTVTSSREVSLLALSTILSPVFDAISLCAVISARLLGSAFTVVSALSTSATFDFNFHPFFLQ